MKPIGSVEFNGLALFGVYYTDNYQGPLFEYET